MENFIGGYNAKKHFLGFRHELEKSSRITDRTLKDYEFYFHMKGEDMRGKTVLDIGSGTDETFAKEAKKLGANVVSMSPTLDVRKKIDKENKSLMSVGGRAQEMPFADNTFDLEFALYSVPFYLPTRTDEYESFLNEIIRTLKVGGKASIFPVDLYDYGYVRDVLERIPEKVDFHFEKNDTNPRTQLLVLIKK